VGKELLGEQVWMEINFTVGLRETGYGGEYRHCWLRIKSSCRNL